MSDVAAGELGGEAAEKARARVGRVVKDKWRLDALLGVGGMASVYSAIHRNQKRVAVKMLHPELSGNGEIRERFLREGYVANTVEHPGAVSVLDDDVTDDGLAFLVMELLEGETLEARWEKRGQKLDPLDVLGWVDALLDVLGAAHAKGIVHRDVKPENLFLTRDGRLKVLDFGIARIFQEAEKSSTRAGFIMGTPAFMAPEQALAKWDEVDARTDLWAVGATMFTLLTGRHVHEATTGNEQLVRSATTPAPPLASIAPWVPSVVVEVVDRALAFDRRARWSDARAMQEAVRSARASLGGAARGEGAPSTGSGAGASGGYPAAPPSQSALATGSSSVDPAALAAHVAEREAERAARAAEIERLRPTIDEINGRLAPVRQKLAEYKKQITQAKSERAATEDRFRRRAGTRAAGVDVARKAVRQAMADFGRRALDGSVGGVAADGSAAADFAAARVDVDELVRARARRQRDVALHSAAVDAYDPRALRTGIGVGAGGILLVLAILFGPLVYRSCVGVPPPDLHPPSGEEQP